MFPNLSIGRPCSAALNNGLLLRQNIRGGTSTAKIREINMRVGEHGEGRGIADVFEVEGERQPQSVHVVSQRLRHLNGIYFDPWPLRGDQRALSGVRSAARLSD